MDPGTSHLQGSNQATLGQPQGQPTYSILPNARDFSIVGSVFNDIHGDVHHHTERTGDIAYCPSLSRSHLTDSSLR